MLRGFSIALIVCIFVSACTGGNPATKQNTTPLMNTTNTTVDQLTIWTFFNHHSPQNDTDRWLAATLRDIEQHHHLQVTNVHQDYAQINSRLSLAVASGGDIPDLSYMNSQQLGFHINHGTLEDITDFVRGAPWFADIEPKALQACTAPDGRIYCVPGHIYSRMIFYWTDLFPQGFPKESSHFLQEADRLKQQGKYAITFKGSEVAAAENFLFGLIYSYGGHYGNQEGVATWATPQAASAIAFLREIVQAHYVPDVAFAPGFDHERVFTDGSAAAFVGGSWSSIYLHPLTAPDGQRYDAGSGSVIAAMKAGKLQLAPYLAAPGSEPVMLMTVPAWAIPKGGKHLEEAKRFINLLMTTKNNADYAIAAGGLPVLRSALADPRFQHEYWTFLRDNQERYGKPMPPFRNYDRAMTILAETMNSLVLNPKRDILGELRSAQEVYNASQGQ